LREWRRVCTSGDMFARLGACLHKWMCVYASGGLGVTGAGAGKQVWVGGL